MLYSTARTHALCTYRWNIISSEYIKYSMHYYYTYTKKELDYFLALQVNNAAVSFNEMDTNSVEHAETVLRTNFYGAKMLTEALLPLFRRSPATSSRILNVSSQLGLLNVSLVL
jgi:NAD(P)-dependent dehydrogenase (short-subunit alcohol dehydrogenase family)